MSDRSLVGFAFNDQLEDAGDLVESLVAGLDLKEPLVDDVRRDSE